MSVDRTTDEWHLTSNGWVQGNYYVYHKLQREEKTPPEHRVETWNRETSQSHSNALEEVWWDCVWVSPGHSQKERDALRKIFGERPRE